jgi:hypothetical protein
MEFIQQGAPQGIFNRCTEIARGGDIEILELLLYELEDEVHQKIDVKTKK